MHYSKAVLYWASPNSVDFRSKDKVSIFMGFNEENRGHNISTPVTRSESFTLLAFRDIKVRFLKNNYLK